MATYSTRQKKIVLDCLASRQGECVSAADLLDALRGGGERVGSATVYRQLERLEREGLVHKAVTEEGAFYRYCEHGRGGGCLLVKCERCGRVEHAYCEVLPELYDKLSDETGFRVDARRTMLYGTCARCQRALREEKR